MNPSIQHDDASILEDDLARLAPVVRAGFNRISGPSEGVLKLIRDQAVSHVHARNRYHRFLPVFRSLSAAAVLALLVGGAIHTHLLRQAGATDRTVGQLLRICTSQTVPPLAEGTGELADSLLTMQGLDEEAFFKHEDSEALWM